MIYGGKQGGGARKGLDAVNTLWWCTPGVSVVVNALRRSFIKADGMGARESRMVIVYYRISRPFFFLIHNLD